MADTQYISLDEATKRLEVARGTLYYYLRALNIQTKKFPLDRNKYITVTDFETIQRFKEDAKNRATKESEAQPVVCSVLAA